MHSVLGRLIVCAAISLSLLHIHEIFGFLLSFPLCSLQMLSAVSATQKQTLNFRKCPALSVWDRRGSDWSVRVDGAGPASFPWGQTCWCSRTPSCHLKSAREAAPGHEAVTVVAGFRSGYALLEAETPPSPRALISEQTLQHKTSKTFSLRLQSLLQWIYFKLRSQTSR